MNLKTFKDATRAFIRLYRAKTNDSSPGHGEKQVLKVSVSLPGQAFPPFIGGGTLHRRVRLIMLPPTIPHVWGHEDQADQRLHWPSTGPTIKHKNAVKR